MNLVHQKERRNSFVQISNWTHSHFWNL